MAGWTVIPNNIALLGNWYICVGTANTSYPINNQNDWNHINQTWVTATNVAGTYTVTLKCHMANATTVSDWDVSGFGIVNHNIGAMSSIDIRSRSSGDTDNATDNSGSATSRLTLSFDNGVGCANALGTFSTQQAITWYVKFTHGSTFTLKVGNLILGKAFDLGYPQRPEQFSFQPAGMMRTETGLTFLPRIVEPTVTRTLTFTDPTYMTAAAIYDRNTNVSDQPSYFSFVKAFETARPLAIAGGFPTYTGISGGAGVPVVYHEGSNNGLSTMGRPAFYGVWNVAMDRNAFRNISPLRVSIVDAVPRGTNIAPQQ